MNEDFEIRALPDVELPAADEQENVAEEALAWELVDAGRYRPRRIRGSYRGRELG